MREEEPRGHCGKTADECDWNGDPATTIVIPNKGKGQQLNLQGEKADIKDKIIKCAKCPIGREMEADAQADHDMEESIGTEEDHLEQEDTDLGDEDEDLNELEDEEGW
jgi:hypothetical protein